MTCPRSHSSRAAGKSGSDPGPSAPKLALFPVTTCLSLPPPLPYPFSPPLCSGGRPAPPSHPPCRWRRRRRRSHVVGPGSRGRGAPGRLPQLGSAALRRAALGARAPRSALPASRPGAGGAPGGRPARQRGAARQSQRGPTDHGLGARAAGPRPEDPAPPGPALGARSRRPGRAAGRTRSPRGAEEAAAAELEGRRGGRPAWPPEPWASAVGAARSSPSAACSW